MKSQIKDIVIGIFAVIGFTAIVMGFNNPAEPQQVTYATPESHVWELRFAEYGSGGNHAYGNHARPFLYNKVTGEIRRISTAGVDFDKDGKPKNINELSYVVMEGIK